MKVIRSIQDEFEGRVTVDLQNGRYVCFDIRDVQEYGLRQLIEHANPDYQHETGRLPVFQRDRQVGTLPATFDPYTIASRTFLYEPRLGDFRREGDRWIADPKLGPGDLEAVPDFRNQ